ncbi:HAD-IA family hydrolase [Ilumatobacter sp.]|uniref:HAD-IA family hydrolase n=1 Tax=Ilumatobacter sp. TaxID=1967498 RepID=UPI003C38C123
MTGTQRERRHDVLLLDFGGVCLLNPVEMHDRAESTLGLPPGTFDWMGPVDPSTDPLWRSMIAGGELTEREYWERRAADVGTAAGRELSLRDYMIMLFDPPIAGMIRPEATDVATRALAAGYGVSILTNDMRAFHGRTWEADVDFLQLVDHLVDCSDTDILKPDPRAFQRAVDMIGVPAERVLFVDDQPLNVKGAESFGLDAVWFDISNAGDAWNDVAGLLALPPK